MVIGERYHPAKQLGDTHETQGDKEQGTCFCLRPVEQMQKGPDRTNPVGQESQEAEYLYMYYYWSKIDSFSRMPPW